ncbi:MAG: hypothetical protein JWM91_4679 [Rhodospirillales bacterium]|nr:hypothetical protein [Rhodospirillales bacterium]
MNASRMDNHASLGETVGGLAEDVQDLVRGEIRLARAELDQKFRQLMITAIWLLGGALVGFAGLVVLLQGVAVALTVVLPAWAAFLIVGLVIVVISAVFVRSGLKMLSLKALSPDRTAANLKRDTDMVKEHT